MLTFNVKKEWFDKIKSGEKTHEYREVKPYWTKRLMKSLYSYWIDNEAYFIAMCNGMSPYYKPINKKIVFCKGYPKKNDKENRLIAIFKEIKIINGKETDLKINKPVYDIEFQLIEGESCRI